MASRLGAGNETGVVYESEREGKSQVFRVKKLKGASTQTHVPFHRYSVFCCYILCILCFVLLYLLLYFPLS